MAYESIRDETALAAVSLSFWACAFVFTAGRIYGRIRLDASRFRNDDFATVAALIAYTVCCVTTVLSCYGQDHAFGAEDAITSISYTLTVFFTKIAMCLYFRREFRNDLPKYVGVCLIGTLITVVSVTYLAFCAAIIASPSQYLHQGLYSTSFSYANVAMSMIWSITNSLTDLSLCGMAICSFLHSQTHIHSRTERNIWIGITICLSLISAASWAGVAAGSILHCDSTISLLQALAYLNRAGGACLAASSFITLRRLLRSWREPSSVPAEPASPVIVENITGKHDDSLGFDASDLKSIRRLTTITIHDDSTPAVLSSPVWLQTEFEDAAAAAVAAAAATADRGSKRYSRRSAYSTKTLETIDEQDKRASTLRRPSSGVFPSPPLRADRLDFTSRI